MRPMPMSIFNSLNNAYASFGDFSLLHTLPLPKTTKSLLILKERNTHELLKCTVENNQIKKLYIKGSILFINGLESPKGKFVKEYLERKFKMKLLSDNNKTGFREYVMSKINYNNTRIRGEKLKDIIINKIQSDNVPEYEKEFAEFIYSLFVNSDATAILDKYHSHFNIKFNLLRKDNKFSGNYKIYSDRFMDNTNHKTFDTFNIEINMYSDYDENLKYVKENIKYVKGLLKYIIEHESVSKDYANYLKLYSLVLNRENILIARFCFKDSLESLCK